MNTNILRKASPKLSIGLTAKKSRFGWVLALTLALWAAVGQAQELRYHYVALNEVPLPAGFVFFSSEAINASGSVYGEVFDEESFAPHVAVYQNGDVTVLQPNLGSLTGSANAEGAIGGAVITDEVNFYTQAALFRSAQVEFIPRLPGEITSSVTALKRLGHGAGGLVRRQLRRDPRNLQEWPRDGARLRPRCSVRVLP